MTDKSQASSIIGELIAREKYRFANADLIAEVVRDTLALYVENEDRVQRGTIRGEGPFEIVDCGNGKIVTTTGRIVDMRGVLDGVGKIDTGRTQ